MLAFVYLVSSLDQFGLVLSELCCKGMNVGLTGLFIGARRILIVRVGALAFCVIKLVQEIADTVSAQLLSDLSLCVPNLTVAGGRWLWRRC